MGNETFQLTQWLVLRQSPLWWIRHLIVSFFYVNSIRDIETIDIFLTLMKLNLKRKKYSFSTHCIENLEDSIKTYDEILEKNTLDFNKDTGVYCMYYITKFFK